MGKWKSKKEKREWNGFYHVSSKSGLVGKCFARAKENCPFGKHFEDYNKAEEYSDSINEQGTTDAQIEKHSECLDILECKAIKNTYINMLNKINGRLTYKCKEEYNAYCKTLRKKGKKSEIISFEQYQENFKETDKEYQFLVRKKENFLHKTLFMFSQRKESLEFHKKASKYIQDYTYSLASASSYFLCNGKDYKKVEKLLKEMYKGMENKIRITPDIEDRIGDNFMIRFADHDPVLFLRSKQPKEKLWDYTEASVLVKFKSNKKYVNVDHNRKIGDYLNEFTEFTQKIMEEVQKS